MKKAKVYLGNALAGILTEDDMGYEFRYAPLKELISILKDWISNQ